MPTGLKGFQKGHLSFRKYTLRVCDIEGCSNRHEAKGLCLYHYKKQYNEDNKEYVAKQTKQYRIDNKERFSEYKKQWEKQYAQSPAGKASRKACSCRRRASLKGLTKETVQRVYEDNIKRFGTLTCYLCNKPIAFGEDSIDHATPLIREGTNDYDNLGIAHLRCNLRKGVKTLEEWFKKNT